MQGQMRMEKHGMKGLRTLVRLNVSHSVSLNLWPPSKILQRVTLLLPTLPGEILLRKYTGRRGGLASCRTVCLGVTMPEADHVSRIQSL